MAVLDALRETPEALLRNPVILVPVLVLSAVQLPQMILQWIDPLLSSLVSTAISLLMIVVIPFFQGGIVGMSNEALDGRTSVDTFVEVGKSKYVSLLAAYLVLLAVNLVVGIFAVIPLVIIGTVLLGGFNLGGVGLAVIAVVGAVVAVAALAYLLILFFLQFYGHAIVLDDLGAVDGLKRSTRRVRHNLLSVLGYSILVGALGGIAGLAFGAGFSLTAPRTASLVGLPEPSLPIIVVIALVVTALATVAGGFFAVYSVSFYRRLTLPEIR